MKEPASAAKAVVEPSVMAPKASARKAVWQGELLRIAGLMERGLQQNNMDSTGQLNLMLTREKKCGKGVTLSRARAHHVRLHCKRVRTRAKE